MVIRYQITEPGITFFHCHINIHTYGGMAVALIEGMKSQVLNIPGYYVKWDEAAAQVQGTRKVRKARDESASGNIAGSLMPRVVRRLD